MKRTPVEKCLLKAALRRLGHVLKHTPPGMVDEQFGIAFVANELLAEGLVGTATILDLDRIRGAAIHVCSEVHYGH